ncbi:MAG: PKD domain-containing protein [Candidatus Thalassarchaeaceae archaeon]|mgnify:CR=1 FL=1|jgi:PKD repeat protein
MSATTRATTIALILSLSALSGCLATLGLNEAPTAQMNIDPSGAVREGDTVTFSAAGSSDPDGDSLTFSWSFGDGNLGTGLTTSHAYTAKGTYSVKLTVGDGNYETSLTKNISVIESTARKPTALITGEKMEDCDGEEAPNGDFVLIWVCDEDKDEGDRSVEFTTTVEIDGSSSDGGGIDYIDSWQWDLDTNEDSDGDGIADNDNDATGQVVTFEKTGGAFEVKLTVTSSNGLTDTDEMMVYVNYRGEWKDFIIDASINDPVEMAWDFPVTYDADGKDRIRYLRVKLEYPQEDDDQPIFTGGATTANKLDLFLYNTTSQDKEVSNTTQIEDENRDAGDDCQDDEYCIWQVVSGSTIRAFQANTWSVDLSNDESHNTKINSFIIELQYR